MQNFRRERPTTFLDLPAEIRVEIYELLLVQPWRRLPNDVDFDVYPHVLCVCRQIHAEAAAVFYGRNEMRLLFYGIDHVSLHWRRSDSPAQFFRVGTLYLGLVKRLELVAFPEEEQIRGEINFAKPFHRLLAKSDGMQGLECLTIICAGLDVTKAQISARSESSTLFSFRDMIVDCLSQVARTTHLTALILMPGRASKISNSDDSAMRLVVPEKVKLAPREVLLDLEEEVRLLQIKLLQRTKVALQPKP
jgi:hypothetical protein